MKQSWHLIALALLCGLSLHGANVWKLDNSQPSIKVRQGDEVVIEGSDFSVDQKSMFALPTLRKSEVKLPKGGVAYNYFSDAAPVRFRQEAAIDAEGREVEITFQSSSFAYEFTQESIHFYELRVPFSAVKGMKYEAVVDRAQRAKRIEGVIDETLKNSLSPIAFRYLALSDGKERNWVFDFNPNGVGNSTVSDYQLNNFRGMWGVVRDGEYLKLQIGWRIDFFGGSQQSKVKIFSGSMQDYDKRHAMRVYAYSQPLPAQKLYSFGSGKVGKAYTPFQADNAAGDGWLNNPKLTQYQDAPQGAFYSSAGGKNAKFRFPNLPNGIWLVTYACGNYGGHSNRFSLAANGQVMLKNFSLAKADAIEVTLPVHVTNGQIDMVFQGNFLVSALGLQFLMADAEDHNSFRGFWRSNAYEPGVLFKSSHYAVPPKFVAGVERFPMPAPGSEENVQPKPVKALRQASPSGDIDWRFNARIAEFSSSSSNLYEFDTPERLNRRFEELARQNINTVMVSGLHSRHTYPAHHKRVEEYLKNLVKAAHEHNIHVIDHEDFSMLWNMDSGFRILGELTPHLLRETRSPLVSTHLCPMDMGYRKKFFNYVVELVKNTGIDGIMIDEMSFWTHGCACGKCRAAFTADTGYVLPVDELSSVFNNAKSPLYRRWVEWRKTVVGNWWVELREAVNQVRPDCTFAIYSTHYGLNGTYAAESLGADLFHTARGNDFIGTEIMTRNVIQSSRSLFAYRVAKNIFRFVYNRPVFGLVYPESDYELAYFGWALNNMLAQVSWEPITPRPANMRDYHNFPGNMNPAASQPVADVALLFSVQSRDWNSGLGFAGELYGTAQTLQSMHIPYVIINEQGLASDKLKQFKVLYAGAAECLSDAQIQVMKEFAQNGGTLFLTTCTGLADEAGQPRDKWGFADAAKFNISLRSVKCKMLISPATGNAFTPKEKPIVYRYASMPPKEFVKYRLTDGTPESEYPLLSAVPYGKGKIIYQNMAIATRLAMPEITCGEVLKFELDEELDKAYRTIWNEALGKRFFTLDAPEKVFVSVYRDNSQKATAVHLLNGTGANLKTGDTVPHGAPKPAFPALDKDIVMELEVPGVQSVAAVSPDFDGEKPLKFEVKGNRVTVILPKELLKAYTIVWFKSK